MSERTAVVSTRRSGGAASFRTPLSDREARNLHFRHLLHFWLPIAVSLAIHVIVFGLLALKTFTVLSRDGTNAGMYSASVTRRVDADDAQRFRWATPRSFTEPENRSTSDVLQQEISLDLPRLALDDLVSRDSTGGLEGVFGDGPGHGGLGLGSGALSLLGTGTGAGAAGTGGFGSGFGTGTGRIGQAGIWDLTVRGDRVAYVVDFSGSIIVAVDDLKRELKRSIGRLQPLQSFNVVIFYSTGAGNDERVQTESFRPELVRAEARVRREFFNWIDHRAPRGATEPLQAIRRALALRPDVVFFFSDGYFDDALIDEIGRANDGGARIYCLVFDELLLQDTSDLPRETEGARRMKRIAEGNRGQVKIVTGRDLSR